MRKTATTLFDASRAKSSTSGSSNSPEVVKLTGTLESSVAYTM